MRSSNTPFSISTAVNRRCSHSGYARDVGALAEGHCVTTTGYSCNLLCNKYNVLCNVCLYKMGLGIGKD